MAAGVGGASAALGAPPTGPGGALVLQFRLDDRTAAMSHRRVLSAACAVGLVLPGAAVVLHETDLLPGAAVEQVASTTLTTAATMAAPAVAPQAAPAATAMELKVSRSLLTGSRSQFLRKGFSGYVVDGGTGSVVWASNAATTRMPASTQKIVTAFVALRSMDPNSRIVARTAQSTDNPANIYVVGAGDPTLTPGRLTAMAQRTAKALQAQKRTKVNLYLDDSLFGPATLGSGWRNDYLVKNAQLVRSLTLTGYRGKDGAIAAGNVVRAQLARQGITVVRYGRGKAPATRATLSTSPSVPVKTMLGHMLSHSDNDYAEAILRLSAVRAGKPGTWNGALVHSKSVLDAHGIPTAGYVARDGSGLSRTNRMPVRTLVRVLAKLNASAPDRAVVFVPTAMPVAGQTGTLGGRFKSPAHRCAAGRVSAKTGTLSDAITLAGIARGVDGRTRIFAFLENGDTRADSVRGALDTLATSTVGCKL